ncbi:MAG TPA: hypothetical protein VFC63_22340 [Blastocatellia bacterium]|nr:hypothetical protein [Blastocatellia bacterium]
MFCPKCSLEQKSETTRFCTRCGFQLSAVKELLATDGKPAQTAVAQPDNFGFRRRRSSRGRAINLVMLVAIIAVATNIHNQANPAASGVAIAILMAVLVTRVIKGMKSSTPPSNNRSQLASDARAMELNQAQPMSVPLKSDRPVDTREMMPVPSVTERTTKVLRDPNS